MQVSELSWYAKPVELIETKEDPIDPEVSARLVMKAALMETTASRGWSYIEKFAETVVREIESAAIAEDDDIKSNGLRRDARGARKFKELLFRRVLIARNVDTSTGFVEVVTD